MQSMFHRAFERLRSEMRDILLSGELHSRWIIDTNALEAAFASEAWRCDELQLRISELVALDLWLAAWRSYRREPVASAA